jgi:hypothetical protein
MTYYLKLLNILLSFVLIITPCNVLSYSTPITGDTTWDQHIKIRSTSSIQFNINSFNRYKNGYELSMQTRLEFEILNNKVEGAEWVLSAYTDEFHLLGDFYGEHMDFDFITLSASSGIGTGEFFVDNNLVLDGEVTLARGTCTGHKVVIIKYSIGGPYAGKNLIVNDNDFQPYMPDYYHGDIKFRLFYPVVN